MRDMNLSSADKRGATSPAVLVLMGPDTIHLSADIVLSDVVRTKLDQEKEVAQLASDKAAHCPEWLGAQVLPHGSRGGYGHLLETDDFSVKVLGKGIPHRPGIYLELRSHFLHTHPAGPHGACEEALCWVRDQLLYDQDETLVRGVCAFDTARLSRLDLHADWQGGWQPSAELGDALRFIKPARVKWHAYHDGGRFTGFVFGSGAVVARIYDKGWQTRQRNDDSYSALLKERNPDGFDPEADTWRLEYQLRREGATGFRLYAEPEDDDDEAVIDAELAAEELPHIGTLPRFFHHQGALWRHLTTHWLRLVEDDGSANRSRWPTHPTWATLSDGYERVTEVAPLSEESYELVRGARYTGKSRVLRRMLLGVVDSLEVEDASPASAGLDALRRWADGVAEREAERVALRKARYEAKLGYVPEWVERGLGERLEKAERVRHRVQMLLGIFAARGVLPLHRETVTDVQDLIWQHLDDLQSEAESKGGLEQVLADHFAKAFKVAAPHGLVLPRTERIA